MNSVEKYKKQCEEIVSQACGCGDGDCYVCELVTKTCYAVLDLLQKDWDAREDYCGTELENNLNIYLRLENNWKSKLKTTTEKLKVAEECLTGLSFQSCGCSGRVGEALLKIREGK